MSKTSSFGSTISWLLGVILMVLVVVGGINSANYDHDRAVIQNIAPMSKTSVDAVNATENGFLLYLTILALLAGIVVVTFRFRDRRREAKDKEEMVIYLKQKDNQLPWTSADDPHSHGVNGARW